MPKKTELEEFIEYALYNNAINQDALHRSYREFRERKIEEKINKLERKLKNTFGH